MGRKIFCSTLLTSVTGNLWIKLTKARLTRKKGIWFLLILFWNARGLHQTQVKNSPKLLDSGAYLPFQQGPINIWTLGVGELTEGKAYFIVCFCRLLWCQLSIAGDKGYSHLDTGGGKLNALLLGREYKAEGSLCTCCFSAQNYQYAKVAYLGVANPGPLHNQVQHLYPHFTDECSLAIKC